MKVRVEIDVIAKSLNDGHNSWHKRHASDSLEIIEERSYGRLRE
jgi:hypothetical protein